MSALAAIPVGECQCGCGGPTSIASETKRDRGWVKGQPLQFRASHYLRREPQRCANGHEFTPENTSHYRDGRRRCRRCMAAYSLRYRLSKGDEPLPESRVALALVGDTGRVPNAPLRAEYLRAVERGVLPVDVYSAAGLSRETFRRCMGLVAHHRRGDNWEPLRSMTCERALAIRAALVECLRWVCSEGCGERLAAPTGRCGWCAEREGLAA
jgi:hypothetical protein